MKASASFAMFTIVLMAGCATSANEQGQSADIHDDVPIAGLAYAKESTDGCNISFFDSGRVLSTTLASVSDCPELLFTSTATQTIYFVLNDELHYIHLAKNIGHTNKLPLPDNRFESYRAELEVKPSVDDFPPRDTNRLSISWAGILSDGRIAIAMYIMPIDDVFIYLFVRNSSKWSIEEQKACDGDDFSCGFDNWNADVIGDYEKQKERDVWSLDQAHNKFLVSAASPITLTEYGYAVAEKELQFVVNGVSALVTARGSRSAHGHGVYTNSVRIVVDGREVRSFSVSTSDASFFDQYLLVHPHRSASDGQLYDMETGEVILDSLKRVAWLN